MAADLLEDACRTLYAADLADFTAVRAGLVAQARKASNSALATQIAALRKPTRSAWTVNQLARAAGSELAELFALGELLRSAQSALDGAQLRQLSAQRRQVVDALVRQALSTTGQDDAPASVREEVRASLDAALADPDVRAQVSAGVLVRPASWSGFGEPPGPVLTVVAPAPARTGTGGKDDTQRSSGTALAKAQSPAQRRARRAADAARDAAERQTAAQADRQRRDAQRAQQRREQARSAVTTADALLAESVAAEKEQHRRVRLAQDQLADARRRLDEIRLDVRNARNQQSKAVKALREVN